MVAENPEECDGVDLAGQSCQTLGYDTGTVSCTPSCLIDTTMCVNTTPTNNGGAIGSLSPNNITYTFPQPENARPDVYRPVLNISQNSSGLSGLQINASDISGVRGIAICNFVNGCTEFPKNFLIQDQTLDIDYIRAYDKAGNVTTYFVDPGAIKRRQIMTQFMILVILIGLFAGVYKLLGAKK